MAYDYTPVITINSVDFTARAVCSFSWNKDDGCDSANISIAGVAFDDLVDIKINAPVSISYKAGTVWWSGIVTDITTSLTGDLSISCASYKKTVLAETKVEGIFGEKVFIPHVAHNSFDARTGLWRTDGSSNYAIDVIAGGNIGQGFHKYMVTAFDDVGERVSSDGNDIWKTKNGKVLTITLTSGGSGYQTTPTVKFTGACTVEATANVTMEGGVVTGIALINAGYGYADAPSISFEGGNPGETIVGGETIPAAAATATCTVEEIEYITDYTGITREIEVDYSVEKTKACSVKLIWKKDDRVSFWRVYKQLSVVTNSAKPVALGMTQLAASAGTGSVSEQYTTSPETVALVYYQDVTEPEFIDDGTIDWANLSSCAMPRNDTCRVSSVPYTTTDKFTAKVVIKWLLQRYWPSGYSAAKIDHGAATTLDDIDFTNEENEINLGEALQAIADFIGKTIWGVDETGKVFFTEKPDEEDLLTETLLAEFYLGRQYTPDELVGVTPLTDVPENCTRNLTRDGATVLQAAVPAKVKAKVAANVIAGKQRIPDSMDEHTLDEYYILTDKAITNKSNQGGTLTAHLPQGSKSIPTEDEYATADDWLNTYSTAELFEHDYPGMSWLWRTLRNTGTSWKIWRSRIRTRLRKRWHFEDTGQGGPRKRGPVVSVLGIQTEDGAARVAANIADDCQPTVGKWSLQLTNVATLFKPGSGLIAVNNLAGRRYIMQLLSVSYDFGDTITATLECGEPDIQKRVVQDKHKVISNLIAAPTRIPVGIDDPVRKHIKTKPSDITRVNEGRGGVSNVAAPIDHEHALNPSAINALMRKDGTQIPNIQRMFTGVSKVDLDGMVDDTSADNVRGLAFREGDSSTLTSNVTGVLTYRRLDATGANLQWSAQVRRMRIDAIADTYLSCTPLDASGGFTSEAVSVLIPDLIQKDEAAEEDGYERIDDYEVGQTILAVYIESGTSGIQWYDLNVAGRHYHPAYELDFSALTPEDIAALIKSILDMITDTDLANLRSRLGIAAPSSELPTPVDTNPGSVGVNLAYARSDHKHKSDLVIPGPGTATPVVLTEAAGTVGTATLYAREDHKHQVSVSIPVTEIQTVLALPAIPGSGMMEVFWTSAGGGTGDDQVWRAYTGQSAYTPTQKLTILSGTP